MKKAQKHSATLQTSKRNEPYTDFHNPDFQVGGGGTEKKYMASALNFIMAKALHLIGFTPNLKVGVIVTFAVQSVSPAQNK